MKKILIFALMAIMFNMAFAAYLTNIPQKIKQPNGVEINCFASGDEFFNYLHDKDGYTIIQDADGYYYYGETKNGIVVPTKYKVGSVDPVKKGLKQWAKISTEEYYKIKSEREVVGEAAFYTNSNRMSPETALLNNVTIVIRFSDDAEFDLVDIQKYDSSFNAQILSMKDYFYEVSYQQLEVPTMVLPYHVKSNVLSYQDNKPRKHFEPYNATTNPEGYTSGGDYSRKTQMMKRAVDWINANAAVPQDLNIDYNNDGRVDNVTFLIYGQSGPWSSLLWPHRSQAPGGMVINGKTVYDYTFNPVDQADRYTLCHEMFHALGAPDLYHYNASFDGLKTTGNWDQMESGQGHMLTHLKERYGQWIDIPLIKSSGYYELKPVLSGKTDISYRYFYPSIDNYESIVFEYRQKVGRYEGTIPGTGLIVTRVDARRKGNAQYDGAGILDEVYVFRPNGTTTKSGNINLANLSDLVKRPSINDTTNPAMYTPRGKAIGVKVYDVVDYGDKLGFKFFIGENFDPINVSAFSEGTKMKLSWEKFGSNNVIILYSPNFTNLDFPEDKTTYKVGDVFANGYKVIYSGDATSFVHSDVQSDKVANYKVYSVNKDGAYSQGINLRALPTSTSVSCNEILNVKPQDTITLYTYTNGGYISGHSSLKKSQFAEEYSTETVGFVNGVTIDFGKVHAANPETSKISVWVALPDVPQPSDDNTTTRVVGEKIYWQEVKISTLEVGKKYIAFEKPVYVSGKFYIGYDIDYTTSGAIDTIAVNVAKHTETRKNTAYAFYKGGWNLLDNSYNLSLNIAARLCNGNKDETKVFSVFPNQISLSREEGASGSFGIWTNQGEWVLTDVPAWLNVIKDYATGRLWVYAQANTSGSERTANIKVAVGGTTENITVVQTKDVSIFDEEVVSKMNVYPNPSADGKFTFVSNGKSTYEVIDYTGRVITGSAANEGESVIDISSSPAGMYFLRVKENNQYRISKLIKQ